MFVFLGLYFRAKKGIYTLWQVSVSCPFVEFGSMQFFKNETFIDNFYPICNMNVKQIEEHGKNVE